MCEIISMCENSCTNSIDVYWCIATFCFFVLFSFSCCWELHHTHLSEAGGKWENWRKEVFFWEQWDFLLETNEIEQHSWDQRAKTMHIFYFLWTFLNLKNSTTLMGMNWVAKLISEIHSTSLCWSSWKDFNQMECILDFKF